MAFVLSVAMMRNFEDILRARILEKTLADVPLGLDLDKQDVEMFAAMIYAILRAGARREGQEGFAEAFRHFALPSVLGGELVGRAEAEQHLRDAYSVEDLELIRGALLAAVDRFSEEATALRIYFDALEREGMSPESATEVAMGALGE